MKTKYYIRALIPLCVIAAVFRVFEIFFAIESDTGFYVQFSPIPLIFNIFSALSVLFFLSVLVIFPKEKKPIVSRFAKITVSEKIAIALSAVCIFVSSCNTFFTAMFPSGISAIFNTLIYFEGRFLVPAEDNYIIAADLKASLIGIPMLMLISAIFIVIFTIYYIKRPARAEMGLFFKLISVFFTIYYVARLFVASGDSSAILSRAYTSYRILFLCSVVLFFMNFSKMLIGVTSKKFMIAFGTCAVFFGAIRFSEFVITLLPNNPHNIDNDIFSYIADFTTIAAIVSMLIRITIRRRRKRPEISDVEPEKTSPVLIGDDEDVINNERMI